MAIKWRAAGALDLAVTDSMAIVSQTVEVYDEADPPTVLATHTLLARRNFNRIAGDVQAQLQNLIDTEWLPQATEACLLAKRNKQADGFEAAATTYLGTLESNQAGV